MLLRLLFYIFALVFLSIGLFLSLMNPEIVSVNYFLGNVSVSLSMTMVICIGIGLLWGLSLSLYVYVKMTKKIILLKSKNEKSFKYI